MAEGEAKSTKEFNDLIVKLNKQLANLVENNLFERLGKGIETVVSAADKISEQSYSDKYEKEHLTAQEKTKQYIGDLAAYGYEATPAEIGSIYQQFSEIEQRRFKAEQMTHMVTTRGTWGTGILENITGINFTQGGESIMEWVQDKVNKNLYLDPETQRKRIDKVISDSKSDHGEIHHNNKVNED